MGKIRESFEAWLAAGGNRVGEISICRGGSCGTGTFTLTHWVDVDLQTAGELECFTESGQARELAKYDDLGAFRPLKTAPNLRRGWKLEVCGLAELMIAIEHFYPAMLGLWSAHAQGALKPVPLRETLGRQTGMYAITKTLSNERADALVGTVCRSDIGCLKTILWSIDADFPIRSLPASKFDSVAYPLFPNPLPLLCHEACNLLVAAARKEVKRV